MVWFIIVIFIGALLLNVYAEGKNERWLSALLLVMVSIMFASVVVEEIKEINQKMIKYEDENVHSERLGWSIETIFLQTQTDQ